MLKLRAGPIPGGGDRGMSRSSSATGSAACCCGSAAGASRWRGSWRRVSFRYPHRREANMSTFDQLQDVLVGTPPGDLAEEIAGRIESLLAACWDDLAGNEGGMTGRKIPGRTEDLKWNPPILTFRIERHGAFVAGSS